MTILVGQKAPLFQTQAVMPNGEINGDFSLGTLIKDKYAVLFFYPMDFTFVCPSEILAMASRTKQLQDMGCCLLYTSDAADE